MAGWLTGLLNASEEVVELRDVRCVVISSDLIMGTQFLELQKLKPADNNSEKVRYSLQFDTEKKTQMTRQEVNPKTDNS